MKSNVTQGSVLYPKAFAGSLVENESYVILAQPSATGLIAKNNDIYFKSGVTANAELFGNIDI